MNQYQTAKTKTVEHYQLDRLIWDTPAAQFWTASHKLLKKGFVLKKLRLQNQNSSSEQGRIQTLSNFDLAKIETSLLNLIKIEGAPKCHKLIRTTTNAYIVLDPFPGMSLRAYLQTSKLSINQVFKLMIDISTQLRKFHSKGLVFYLLSTDNIFIRDSNMITFADWTLARLKDLSEISHKELLNSLKKAECFRIKTDSMNSSADIYTLSSIFSDIVKSQLQIVQPQILMKLMELFNQMSSQIQSPPDLNTIVQALEDIYQSSLQIEPRTPTFSIKSSSKKNETIEQRISRLKLKRVGSDNIENELLTTDTVQMKKIRKSRNLSNEENFLETENRSGVSPQRPSSISSKSFDSKDFKFIGKTILKRRGLAFFLISLSQFMQDRNLEICFMLLKKARCSFKSAQTECDKLKEQNQLSFNKISALLQSETTIVESLLTKVRSNLFDLNLVSEMKREYTNIQSMVNLKHLTAKIKEYVLAFIGSNRISRGTFAQAADAYFNIYLMMKTIECGSYELFWDKTYKRNTLTNQQYFTKQKKLGLRYFKSKIEESLNKQI